MGDISEFSLTVRLFMKTYPWRRIDPVPWTPLKKPLSECNVALVTSAGFVLQDQEPFDAKIKGGDWSFREIPDDTQPTQIAEFHKSQSFDHTGIHEDSNLALPIDRLHEMRDSGCVGSVNHRHLSFMGSITAPGRLIKLSAPEAAQIFVRDNVDVVLLVPV